MTQLTTYKPGQRLEKLGLCVFGRNGSGKTSLLRTMPGNGLLVDIPQMEGGDLVLSGAGNIVVTPVTNWDAIQQVYWHLAKDKHDYKWVAIDTMTAMLHLAVRKVLGMPEEIGEADLRKKVADKIDMRQLMGSAGRMVGELVFQYRKLPVHTIFLAQERTFGGENDPKIIGPAVAPQAAQMLMQSLILVGQLTVSAGVMGQPTERHLRVGPHDRYYTKYRATPGAVIPDVVRNPNLGTLLPALFGRGSVEGVGPSVLLS